MTSYIYDMVDTWDAGATTFTAVKMNVTDTASASGSLLMDLQVGGSSRFNVGKTGSLKLGVNPTGTNQAGTNVTIAGSQGTGTGAGGSIVFQVAPAGSSGTAQNGLATFVEMTSTRAFNLYNTTDVTTNFERGKIAWSSNVLQIGTEKAGTGTARALEFQTDGTTRLTINSSGDSTFSGTVTAGTSGFIVSGRGRIESGGADGKLVIRNSSTAGFDMLMFGGANNTFPAIKRSSTALQARLADDSAFATIQGKLRADVNAVAETPTATHTITITDAAGTAYKVLCVAA